MDQLEGGWEEVVDDKTHNIQDMLVYFHGKVKEVLVVGAPQRACGTLVVAHLLEGKVDEQQAACMVSDKLLMLLLYMKR